MRTTRVSSFPKLTVQLGGPSERLKSVAVALNRAGIETAWTGRSSTNASLAPKSSGNKTLSDLRTSVYVGGKNKDGSSLVGSARVFSISPETISAANKSKLNLEGLGSEFNDDNRDQLTQALRAHLGEVGFEVGPVCKIKVDESQTDIGNRAYYAWANQRTTRKSRRRSLETTSQPA